MLRASLLAAVLAIAAGCGFAPNAGGNDGGGSAVDALGSGDGSLVIDGPPPQFPSHVGSDAYVPGASALANVMHIDTMMLTIDTGMGPKPPPAGVTFVDDGAGHAVLSCGTWVVDGLVTVSGNKSLVVVAAGDVTISNFINAGAAHEAAGPGAVATGDGLGSDGVDVDAFEDSGGGGGGHGIAGATGGSFAGTGSGANGGGAYGAAESDFAGGAPGGDGGSQTSCPGGPALGPMMGSKGGGGGGAFQISSATSITIAAGVGIGVGGGGGRGGCNNGTLTNNPATGGGGGGGGGEIFLEAPLLDFGINSALNANGGGGGGGALSAGPPGGDGSDGFSSMAAAAGGMAGGSAEGSGGNGAIASTPPTPGTIGSNGGGGGGAVGVIWLRSHGSATSSGIVTPAAHLDTAMPIP